MKMDSFTPLHLFYSIDNILIFKMLFSKCSLWNDGIFKILYVLCAQNAKRIF